MYVATNRILHFIRNPSSLLNFHPIFSMHKIGHIQIGFGVRSDDQDALSSKSHTERSWDPAKSLLSRAQ